MIMEKTTGTALKGATAGKNAFKRMVPREERIADLMKLTERMDSKFKAPNCQWCPASKSKCYYSQLSSDVKPVWSALRKHIKYKDKQEIFYQGMDPIAIYIVCVGQAGIMRMDEGGNELLAHIAERGELVGDRAVCAGGKYKESAIVIGKDTVITHIYSEPFDQLLELEPHLVRILLKVRSRELGSAEKRAIALAFASVNERVEDVLAKKSKNLRFNYTQDHLAAMTGVAPETLNRALATMKSHGLIKSEGNKAIILTQLFVQRYNEKMNARGKKRRLGKID